MKNVSKSLVVWAALAALTLGCSETGESVVPGIGGATVTVDASALSAADIDTLKVTVSGSDFSPAVSTVLEENPEETWSGSIDGIPAGENRVFTAEAFDSEGNVIYEGVADGVTIVEGQTASVTIYLQQADPVDPFANAVPVITAFTASSMFVEPEGTVALTVTAVDADPEDTLTYAWSADKGEFSNASDAATFWTAPAALGATEITVSVTDPQGATASLSATIITAFEGAVGDADIDVVINTAPEVLGLVPSPARIDAGESTVLDLTVVDRDGNDLAFAWTADCDGTFDDVTAEDPTFTLNSVTAATCTLTAVVSDGMGAENTAGITIETGAGAEVEYEDGEVICTPQTFTFDNAVDTVLMQLYPDDSFADAQDMSVGLVYSGNNSESQILMQFGDILGSGAIPAHAVISSAALTVYAVNPTDADISLHRMAAAWDADATWNSMTDGVVADGVEAALTADDILNGPGADAYYTFDVTDSVMAWKDGAPNNGWVFLSNGTNGWDINASEADDAATRPVLVVEAEICESTGGPEKVVSLALNPYADVNWAAYGQYKANFHTHTTNSDGAQTPTEVIDEYHAGNYDILSITDHNTITWPWTDYDRDPAELGMLAVRGDEYSSSHHMNAFHAFDNASSNLESGIPHVDASGGLTFIAHPGRYSTPADWNWYVPWYRDYSSCVGIEVYNQGDRYSNDRALWDNINENYFQTDGKLVWGYSNDDKHRPDHLYRNYQFMLMPELTQDALMTAQRDGAFYFVYEPNGNGDASVPRINEIIVDDATKTVAIIATDYDNISWIGPGTEVVAVGDVFDYSAYTDKPFVRAILESAEGDSYTQPFGFVTEEVTIKEYTVESRVSSSMDDVEESTAGGIIYSDSSDLELGYDSHVGSTQVVGIRFEAVAVPEGAEIVEAYVQFTCDETDADAVDVTIVAEAADNAAPFTMTDYDVSARAATAAAVTWSIPEWDTVGEAGADQRTPDLSAMIQEVVDRAGWAEGNALAVMMTAAAGTRTAESFDGSSDQAAQLVVTYTVEM